MKFFKISKNSQKKLHFMEISGNKQQFGNFAPSESIID